MEPTRNIARITLLALPFYFLITHISFAAEGDIIQDWKGCYIKQADSSEKEIPCPQPTVKTLNQDKKAELIDSLAIFEKSSLSKQAKLASKELKSKTANKDNFSPEIIKKSKKIKDGKYLARIVFVNNADYLNKSSSGRGYFISGNGNFEFLDSTAEAQWDQVILTNYIGADYKNYDPSVDAVTSENVIITVSVANSDQLMGLIKDKKVKSIDHAGLAEVEYQEVTR